MNTKVIHSVFEEYAVSHPLKIAIETATETLTYSDLNSQANRLADLLRKKGNGKEDIVATLFDNELLQIFALLGVFKSGSIYLPLDKKYKDNHWSQLYRDMRPVCLLTTVDHLDTVYRYNAIFEYVIPLIVTIEADVKGHLNFTSHQYQSGKYETIALNETFSDLNLELISEGDDANYIFFTSGSTGRPKAVLGQHKSLSHFIHWESKTLEVNGGDRLGQFTSFSFDASLRDVFVPLINGGTICIPSRETKEDSGQLAGWLAEQRITILHTIPTLFRLLIAVGITTPDLHKYPHLRCVLLAGEKLYHKDITDWRSTYGDGCKLINLYGATESTLVKSFYVVEKELEGRASDVLPVGQPISNTIILILNAEEQLCRVGEVGHIYIRTPFLSKGYFRNEAETAEKFVQNPLITVKDIIYKTGDYGRYDAARNVIVLGREDGIVKLNGVRIDINAIEAVILESGNVDMVKCMVHEAGTLNAALACFYTSASLTEKQLRHYCGQYLSQYESPSIIFRLDEFPMNVNGKTDTVLLKESIGKRLSDTPKGQKPSGVVAQKLSELWEEVLNIEQVSVDESFIALGGNSIRQVFLRSKIRMAFNVQLSFEELFKNDTIIEQAKVISTHLDAELTLKDDHILPLPYQPEGYVLSSEQLRIWVTSQSDEESMAHNMSGAYDIQGDLDVPVLKKALQTIVERHEALRTGFTVNTAGEVVQVIFEGIQVDEVFEYILASESYSEAQLKEDLRKFSSTVFTLSCAPLFRILLIELPGNSFCFSTLMHHIIGDYTSDEVIIRELMELYHAYKNGNSIALNKISVQYKDYASWITGKLAEKSLSAEGGFWNKHLENLRRLPKWYSESQPASLKGAYYSKTLNDELVQGIRTYCAKTNRNLMGVMASALAILIHKTSGQQDIVIGVPVNLRTHPELIGQVGLYLNLLPFRVQIDSQDTLESVLRLTAENQMKLMDHSFYPFDRIVDEFEQHHKFNLIDRIDVYLNFINHTEKGDSGFGNLEINPRDRELKMSKFPICFYVSNHESRISVRVEYQTSVFDQTAVSRLTERFCSCLEQLVKMPEQYIYGVNLISRKSIPTFSLS